MNILEVKDLHHSYNDIKVLKGTSFEVKENELVAIIGDNGTGKSTLLKLLTGSLPIQKGSITYFGDSKNNIGYVKQKTSNFASFPTTVKELVFSSTYNITGFLKKSSKEQKAKALYAIKQVGLDGFEKRLLSQLSGGQLQRALIARAIALESPIIILDEPTSGIDPSSVDGIFSLLSELAKQKSIIVVTHDLQMVDKYASRIFCLGEGNALELPKKQLEHELAHKHTHEDGNNHNCDHCVICEEEKC